MIFDTLNISVIYILSGDGLNRKFMDRECTGANVSFSRQNSEIRISWQARETVQESANKTSFYAIKNSYTVEPRFNEVAAGPAKFVRQIEVVFHTFCYSNFGRDRKNCSSNRGLR